MGKEFMRQSTQEDLARKRFDCELPADARTELVAPKRPRILGRSRPIAQASKAPLYFVLLICAVVLAGVVTTLWRRGDAERAPNQAISLPTATPQPTVVPSPTPGPAPRTMLTKGRVVPRAQLVRHSVPRAQLVALPPAWPPLFVGGRYLATMPYGLEVLATYRGERPSQDDLPSQPNRIGDMFVVNGVPFVWIWAPGAAHADWIDP